MGADQNLIKAASQMGAQPFDYSGILNAIRAIGQYRSSKKAVVNELVTYGNKNFKINEMPQEIFQGVNGDQNMNFLINAQNEYYKASEVLGKSRSGSKKYKDAAKKINQIKTMFEKNKADAETWASMQGEIAHKNWTNRSAGIGFDAENRLADIVTNPYSGQVNSSLIMTPNGIMVQQPAGSGDDPLASPSLANESIDLGGSMYVTMDQDNTTELYNISDIMRGYKENLAYKKIKLDDGSTLNIGEEIDAIILKHGKNAKLSGRNIFEENLIRNDFSILFERIKKLGPDGLRSAAYDYKNTSIDKQTGVAKHGTFVNSNSAKIMGKTDEEWTKMVEENAASYDPMFETASPTAEVAEEMKKHVLTSAFSTNNYSILETEMVQWLVDISSAQHTNTKPSSTDDRSGIVMATNKRIYLADFSSFVKIMNPDAAAIKAGADPTRTVNLGGDTYRYVKQTKDYTDVETKKVYKLKGKMAWEYNYNGSYEPIPERAGGTAGSGKSFYSLLNNRPEFAFLLEEQFNLQ